MKNKLMTVHRLLHEAYGKIFEAECEADYLCLDFEGEIGEEFTAVLEALCESLIELRVSVDSRKDEVRQLLDVIEGRE